MCVSHLVMSSSLWPQGLYPTRLLWSMGFFRPEYWTGLPFPSPSNPADPGIEPQSAALQADSLPSEPPGKHHMPMKTKSYSPVRTSPPSPDLFIPLPGISKNSVSQSVCAMLNSWSSCGCISHVSFSFCLLSGCIKPQNSPGHCVCLFSPRSCPTLCGPMDCSPPGPSVHGTSQARTLGWVAMPSSRRSSQPRDRTHVSYIFCIGRQVLYH